MEFATLVPLPFRLLRQLEEILRSLWHSFAEEPNRYVANMFTALGYFKCDLKLKKCGKCYSNFKKYEVCCL